MKLKTVIFSWDFVLAVLISLATYFILPSDVGSGVIKDVCGLDVTILGIIFALFLAALTLMVSASDDDFICFLEESEEAFTKTLEEFRFVSRALLLSLCYAAVMYAFTAYEIDKTVLTQSKYWAILLALSFFYSLFAVQGVTEECIKFAHYRTKHLRLQAERKAAAAALEQSERQ